MRVKLGSIVTEASGKLGGFVASKSGTTVYLKSQPSVHNSQSNAHNSIKERTTTISQSWKLLSEDQRLNWETSAVGAPNLYFGVSDPFRSGYSFYSAVQQIRLLGINTLLPNPPVYLQPPLLLGNNLTVTTGSLDQFIIDFTGTTLGANRFQVFATRSLSPSISYVDKLYKQLALSTFPIVSNANYYDYYHDVFGPPIAGGIVHLKMRWFHRNRCSVSPFIYLSTIVQSI